MCFLTVNVEITTFHGGTTVIDVMPPDQEVEEEEMMMVWSQQIVAFSLESFYYL